MRLATTCSYSVVKTLIITYYISLLLDWKVPLTSKRRQGDMRMGVGGWCLYDGGVWGWSICLMVRSGGPCQCLVLL